MKERTMMFWCCLSFEEIQAILSVLDMAADSELAVKVAEKLRFILEHER